MLFHQIMRHVCDEGCHELQAGGPNPALLPTLQESPHVTLNHSLLGRLLGLNDCVDHAFVSLLGLLFSSCVLLALLSLSPLSLDTSRLNSLLNDLVLGLQVKNLGQLALEVVLFICVLPPLNKLKARSQRHQHNRSNALCAVLLFVIVAHFELFVGEMEELFVRDFEDSWLLLFRESCLEVLLGKAGYIRARVKEGCKPKWEDLLNVRS